MNRRLIDLVRQIPAANPEELERKLELLAKAGTLAELERKLGYLSAFDANLLKLLRRIPARNHHELERKIASLIPKERRAAALAEEKEGSWRGYNSFLINLARRIPAADPAELEAKIASLIPDEGQSARPDSYPGRLSGPILFAPVSTPAKKSGRLFPGAAVARDTSGSFTISLSLLPRFEDWLSDWRGRLPLGRITSALRRRHPQKLMPEPLRSEPERTATDGHIDRPAAAADPPPAPQPIPAEPFFTQPQHLAPFGPRCERVDKTALVAAARDMAGGAIDLSFPRFVEWLRSEGYGFAGFEEGPPRFDERLAYLRYDVHQADLLAAYVLADWHERFGIVGSFQITWKFSRDQEEAEPYFLKLLEFDRRFVQFGLHAAPTATWYLYEKLGLDAAVDGVVDGEDFAAWVLDLHAAYCRDGDDAAALREIRQGTDDTLSRIAASFKASFGEWRSISGHGNFLTKAFDRVRQSRPELEALLPYFYPEAYLAKWGLARFGFDQEITSFGVDSLPYPRVLFENNPAALRRQWYRGRVAHGAGFVALLHPASWTCAHNATFFLSAEHGKT